MLKNKYFISFGILFLLALIVPIIINYINSKSFSNSYFGT